MYRIGIDVGGTNTDAVIMQEGKILTGVKSAIDCGCDEWCCRRESSEGTENTGINKLDVSGVMIGTTHFHKRCHRASASLTHSCNPALLASSTMLTSDGRLA